MLTYQSKSGLPRFDIDAGWCLCASSVCTCMYLCVICLSVVEHNYTFSKTRKLWYQPDARQYGICVCSSCRLNIICMPPRSVFACFCS